MVPAPPLPADIRDPGLAEQGKGRTDWAARHMPVLRGIAGRFARERPLEGVRIGVSLHLTTETAVLLRALRAGGARLAVCPSNPLSTRDDVCATLVVDEGIPVFARYGEDLEAYHRHVEAVLDTHQCTRKGVGRPTLHIEHPTPDSATWKRAFSSDPADRQRSCARRYPVSRDMDDPNDLMIDLEFATRVQAEGFLIPTYGAGSASPSGGISSSAASE